MSTPVTDPPPKRWFNPNRRHVPTAAEMPAERVAMARVRHGHEHSTSYWPELTPERLRRRRIGNLDLWIDLVSGKVYTPIRSRLWDTQARLVEPNEATVDAWALVDDDVVFLERSRVMSTLADVDSYDQRRVLQEAQQVQDEQRAAAALSSFRERQPLVRVTLAEVVGRPLPTIKAAADMIFNARGTIAERDGQLDVQLPQRVATDPKDEAELRAPLVDATRVLFAARNVVLSTMRSASHGAWSDRLPDRHVSAGGRVVS